MATLDYLWIISEETKQKLIGLCYENEEMELEENEI